jgi:peptide/histidine transporter 3/4
MENHMDHELTSEDDICLVDSATTHTILKSKVYFSYLVVHDAVVNTISGSAKLIEGSGRAGIMLPCGTKININEALYSPKSQRNLLIFKDIRQNGYHIETICEDNLEYLNITKMSSGTKHVLEKLSALSSSLYYMLLNRNVSYMMAGHKFSSHDNFVTWHDRLGHPGSIMMRKIINNSCGHMLKNQKVLQSNEFICFMLSREIYCASIIS